MDNKKLIFTSLIVLALVVAALSITYALNVNVTQNTTSDYDLSYTFDISDNATWTINLEAGKTKIYDIAVTNPYNDSITYGVVYKMDNPTTMPSNSLVGIVNTSENSSQGTLNANSEKNISIAIVNGSNSNMQVTLSVISGYKNGGDLIIPEGYTLITDEYDIVTNEPNSPDLVQGLIPIRYETTTDSNGNNVTKVLKEDAIPQKATATCNSLGDLSGDGKINSDDTSVVMRIYNNTIIPTDSQLVCADVDGDGVITENDSTLILRYAVKLITTFPAGEPFSQKTGTVTRTNTWYNYDEKRWANAVLVSDTNRNTYQNAKYGTEIAQSDILAYYVWIPRYKYKVWNISKQAGAESTYAYNAYAKGIKIKWENEKDSTGRISCEYNYNVDTTNGGIDLSTTTAETCTGSNGQYYTHPAFTFGSDELRGFWISKYEISSSSPTTTYGGGKVMSLPNVNSWRSITVSNINTVIQNMQTSSNIYGLSTSRTNTDSHMLTNFEWGAVAYLTNSKYGRCTNGSCTEVTINNCNTYVTGIGANTVSAGSSSTTCTTAANQYNGTYGKLASTTGNVTGVYDMSGGAYEYTMGNISKVTTGYTFYPSNSSFASSWYTTDTAKYVTTYAYDTVYNNQKAYNRGRLGDATAETLLSASSSGGWYGDYTYFPYSSDAWFRRGGDYIVGSIAGVFSFGSDDGNISTDYSSRAALVSLSA